MCLKMKMFFNRNMDKLRIKERLKRVKGFSWWSHCVCSTGGSHNISNVLY